MLKKSLLINPADTVVVLLENARKGDIIDIGGKTVALLEDVEFAHKVAHIDHPKMSPVVKYGEEIGYLPDGAPAGAWIHSHNMKCDRGR